MLVFRATFLLPLLLTVSSTATASPAVSVTSAAADLSTVAEIDHKHIRFQSLPPMPAKDRDAFVRSYAFVVNSLSRKARLRKPADLLVTPELIRLDLRDFKWDAKVYDRLATIDPYFHAAVTVEEAEVVEEEQHIDEPWPGGLWTDERGNKTYYPKGAFKTRRTVKVPKQVSTGKKRKDVGTAPWLPADKMAYLVEKTQSKAPILRADWFLKQVSTQEGAVAGYYDFLGLKSRDDFFQLIGFDKKAAQDREREVATIVLKSGVSEFPRQIFRFGANDGGSWQTKDVFNRTTDERNAVNALDADFKHQAERHYGLLSNGLFAYYLCDDKGKQQNFAPPEVGSDTTAATNGMRIHIFKSCVSCHTEGLKPIKDVGRTIWRGRNQLIVASTKDHEEVKAKFDRLEQLYLLPYQSLFDRDNAQFTQTLLELNGVGWTTGKNSASFARIYREWAETDVSVAQAALEIGDGLTDKLLITALKKWASPVKDGGLGQVLPPTLQFFTREDDKGNPAPLSMLREHFEEVYPIIQYAVRGVVPK